MVKNRGLSLIELLIGTVLGAMALVVVSQLFFFLTKQVNKSQGKLEVSSNLLSLSGALQKYMASGDSRFFAFSGNGASGDQTLARLIVPLQGTCGDLSTSSDCASDTALVYVHYNKGGLPALSAVCNYDSDTLLIDTKNPTYGLGTYTPNHFDTGPSGSTNFTSGTISLSLNTMIALAAPPNVSLWLATGNPTALTVTYDSVNKTFTPALSPECLRQLQPTPTASAPYDLSGLYTVPIAPMLLTQFTAGSAVTVQEKTTSIGQFPMPLFTPTIRSVGRKTMSNQTPIVGLFECSTSTGSITCPSDPIMQVPGITRMRIDEFFKSSLGTDTVGYYEVITSAMPQSAACALPDCKVLPQNSNTEIPVLYPASPPPIHTENFSLVTSDGFSLLKQQIVSKIRIRFSPKNQPEQSIYVLFP